MFMLRINFLDREYLEQHLELISTETVNWNKLGQQLICQFVEKHS